MKKNYVLQLKRLPTERLNLLSQVIEQDFKVFEAEVLRKIIDFKKVDKLALGATMSRLVRLRLGKEFVFLPLGPKDRRMTYVINPNFERKKLLEAVNNVITERKKLLLKLK